MDRALSKFPKTRFKLRTASTGSNWSANWATCTQWPIDSSPFPLLTRLECCLAKHVQVSISDQDEWGMDWGNNFFFNFMALFGLEDRLSAQTIEAD